MTSQVESSFLEQCETVLRRLPEFLKAMQVQIRTEEEGWQVIEPNRVQMHYHKDHLSRGFAAHDDILKARKHGFTTWKALTAFILAYYIDGFQGAIVVDEKEKAKRLFKIVRAAYDRMPEQWRKARPLDEDRSDAIDFGGSAVFVQTAGAGAAGRGDTLHFIHCSEIAFWANPEDTMTGLIEAAPRFAHIAKESTPNGRDNYWYQDCMDARNGVSSYKLHFYPWWWGDENALPLLDGEVLVPTEEEQDVIMSASRMGFTLTHEQLKWRRMKVGDLREKFFQEHPEDPETCFLMSGNPVHEPQLLRRLVQRAESAMIMRREYLPGGGDWFEWKQPSGKHPYVISSDVAEGLAHGDWSTISVWQHSPEGLVNVARGKLHCSTDDLAHRLCEESDRWYKALLVPERNSIGSSVIRKIIDLGYADRLYQETDIEGYETDRYGWYTNVRTKKQMIEEFKDEVAAGNIVSWDAELWGEAMNIVRDDLGRPVTPRKKHDDLYMSACIANMAKEQARSHQSALVVSYV